MNENDLKIVIIGIFTLGFCALITNCTMQINKQDNESISKLIQSGLSPTEARCSIRFNREDLTCTFAAFEKSKRKTGN
jgi:hypothetical protein